MESAHAPVPAAVPAAGPVRLSDVARLAKEAHVAMPAAERLVRRGPFPLYAENCTVSSIDDYALEAGGTVMVASFGQVITGEGRLLAVYEPGRCSATEHIHAIVPHDPVDARYLWRVIANSSRAAHLVSGTSQLRQLGGPALMSAPIPWPERSVREAFVGELDELERRIAELEASVPDLLAQGDEAFRELVVPTAGEQGATVFAGRAAVWHRGTDVPAADRGPEKPVRVEGPRGVLGRCDGALAQGPIVAVGPVGRHLLAHYVDEPCHPIAEMRFAQASPGAVPLPLLLFALRAAGIPDRLQGSGESAGAARLTMDDFEGVPLVVGTPEAQEAFLAVAGPLLDQVCAAQREAAQLIAARRELADSFVNLGVFHGEPLGQAELPTPPLPPAPLAERDPLQPASPFGPLAPLVNPGAFRLSEADFAWELGPLAVVRAVASPGQWAPVALAAGSDAAPDHLQLVGALDAVMAALAEEDDLLSFLPNLSYGSSLLSPAQLASLVRGLDALEPRFLNGSHVRAVFALDPAPATPGLPVPVGHVLESVIESLAARLPQGWETAYVPFESSGAVVDALGRLLPNVTLRAQFDEFAPMLVAAMVRAVELRSARETRGGLGAASGSALAYDEFPDWVAPLVAAVLPPNPGVWSEAPVNHDDPRWQILGAPPRNKANFAWIQQALAHQEEGGATVLLLAASVLHSTSGCEKTLRKALAGSGRVRLVAVLPARVCGPECPAMALMVLGDPVPPGEPAPCLMVNAIGLAAAATPATADGSARALPIEAAERIASVCRPWLLGYAVAPEPGFVRVVDRAEVMANEGLLAPWSYA